MSVLELKKKEVSALLETADDEKVLEQVLELLKKGKQTLTADEVFHKVAAKYDNTLRRLAQ